MKVMIVCSNDKQNLQFIQGSFGEILVLFHDARQSVFLVFKRKQQKTAENYQKSSNFFLQLLKKQKMLKSTKKTESLQISANVLRYLQYFSD